MSIGDFLSDWYDSASGSVGSIADAFTGAFSGKNDVNETFKGLGSGAVGVAMSPFYPVGRGIDYAADFAPVAGLLQVIDAPRRAINTALITAQRGDFAASRGDDMWAEVTNTDTWSRAWEMSSMDAKDPLTGGALLVGNAIDPEAQQSLDPFDAEDARRIQETATDSAVGSLATTMLDFGASLVSVPGLGQANRVRKASGLTNKSLVEVDEVASRFADVGMVERTTGQKAADTARLWARPGAKQNVDALVERQVKGLRELDGLDSWGTFQKLKSRMESAPDADVATVANLMTEIGKVADPLARERLRTSTFLASMGSQVAKRELIRDAPLLAKNLQGLTSTPREIAAMEELYAKRLADEDFSFSEVADRTWNRPGDAEELDKLKELVRDKRGAFEKHSAAVADLKALRPSVKAEYGDWRTAVDQARARAASAFEEYGQTRVVHDDLLAQVAMKDDEIRAVSARLASTNRRIDEVLAIGSGDSLMALSADARPTVLARVKERVRDYVGDEHYVTAGEGNTIVRVRSLPSLSMRRAMSPTARGSISLSEIGLGGQQLADAMGRSKVFTADEIRDAKNQLLRVGRADAPTVVASVQDSMVQRMAERHLSKDGGSFSPEMVKKYASQVRGVTLKAYGEGSQWVAKAAADQVDDDLVAVRSMSGEHVMFDGPQLRSHLADNAPMLDPWEFEKLMKEHEGGLRANMSNGVDALTSFHDGALAAWKSAALIRPGLLVRSQLDSGARALASMTAAEALASSMNGAANLIHNKALRGVAKVRLGGLPPDKAAERIRSLALREQRVGGESFQFASDVENSKALAVAMNKGSSVSSSLFNEFNVGLSAARLDRSKWKRREQLSPTWHQGYSEYASQLLASPLVRRVAEMKHTVDDSVDVDSLISELKASPEFRSEYGLYARAMGRTRTEFLNHVVHEVGLMFPTQRVLAAAKSGGLSRKLLDREFPRESRFDVPAPDQSLMEAPKWKIAADKVAGSAFRTLLDKPDMWLSKNPTAVSLYNRRIRSEVAALQAKHGPGYEMTKAEYGLIDSRARAAAVGYVRRTFFDTTRRTNLHEKVARISPFFGAWEDAMMSWGRLIHDDPRRITKLAATYAAPFTVQSSLGVDLVVNGNGEATTRGQAADEDGVFIQVPANLPGMKDYRVRLDSFNTIAQGDTWWLPGFGPTVTAPATAVLGGATPLMDRETALDIIETDNPVGKAVLSSMFLDGEVPEASAGALAESTLPGWIRTAFTTQFGTGFIRSRQTIYNYMGAEALASGKILSADDHAKMWDEAGRRARAAGMARLGMQGVFGLSGTAVVDGQFYVDQMNIIYAMPDEMRDGLTPEEFFAREYPEAADLNWRITRNETGVMATVHAAKAESRLEGLLSQPGNRDVSWMVLGRDNMVDGEFSRTAHSMQRAAGGRRFLSAEESQMEAMAAVGERQYRAWSQQVFDALDPKDPDAAKKFGEQRKIIREYLMETNSGYAKSATEMVNKREYYMSQARRLSSSSQLRNRSDMVAFRDYDEARSEIMAKYKIKGFSGSSAKYADARAMLGEIGMTLAEKDLGFQQMWDKFLEREVEDAATGG